jgi:hypothetical protein
VRYLLIKLLLPSLLVGSFPAVAQLGGLLGAAGLRPDSARGHQPHRRIVAQFDQRYSLLNGDLVGINGFKLGIEWRGRLRTGLGLYLLSDGVPSRAPIPLALPPETRTELRFRYVAVYGEYVLVGTPRWELSTPTQFGFGKVFTGYYLPDGSRRRSTTDHIWLFEPSLVGHMRVFRWVGVGAGAGYRQMLFLNGSQQRELSGVIFLGRVKLFLGDLYKIIRGREQLLSQKGLRRADQRKSE